MTDLASWWEEMRDRIHGGPVENSARFHPNVQTADDWGPAGAANTHMILGRRGGSGYHFAEVS